MNGTTIYHIHLKATDEDFYFGSIVALCEYFKPEFIAVSRGRLYNFGITEDHPYSNKACTIRKGDIKRKKGKRQVPLLRL